MKYARKSGCNGHLFPNLPRFKMRLFRSLYQNLLEIGKSRKGAIFLDIGSCSENYGSL